MTDSPSSNRKGHLVSAPTNWPPRTRRSKEKRIAELQESRLRDSVTRVHRHTHPITSSIDAGPDDARRLRESRRQAKEGNVIWDDSDDNHKNGDGD